MVHLVVSTGSGTGRALEFYHLVLRPLLEGLGLRPGTASETDPSPTATADTYSLFVTRDAQSIRDFAGSLHGGQESGNGSVPEHTVVLLSGDGGVVEMLNGIAPESSSRPSVRKPLVAILAVGTGNALFHSLHKSAYVGQDSSPSPTALVLGLRTLLRGRPAPLPSFRASFSAGSKKLAYAAAAADAHGPADAATARVEEVTGLNGAIVASYGFHSQLVWESDTPAYRQHGDKRFGMVAQELLRESHAYDATVRVRAADGPSPERQLGGKRHAYALATLVSNLEKTFTISPGSRPLDGILRLVHFGPVSGARTMEIMMAAYDGGKHVDMKWTNDDTGGADGVDYEDVAEMTLTTLEEDPRWRKVCIDGTIVELPQGGSMTVRMDAQSHLQVLVDPAVLGGLSRRNN